MAEICPRCSSTNISHDFNDGHCQDCGVSLNQIPDGSGKFEVNKDGADLPLSQPADSSLATPTATPVYAEDALTRQPVIDTNQEPVPTDVPGGPQTVPAPDREAVNVAGELSDETPEEKKHGGPSDQPRTADLTRSGKPSKDTFVTHSTDDEGASSDELGEPDHSNLDAEPKKATHKRAVKK